MKLLSKGWENISLWIPITFTAVIGILFSVTLYLQLQSISKADLKQKVFLFSTESSGIIVDQLNNSVRELEGIKRFYYGSDYITRKEFRNFVTPILEEKGIQAIEWLPRVQDSERAKYELQAKKDGYINYTFTELDSNGVLITANKRDEYFPVFYLEPYLGNETALCYAPPLTNPARGNSIKIACDSNKASASERITLVQEKDSSFAVLVVLPIYKISDTIPASVEKRRKNLIGFVQGVLKPKYIVESALKKFSKVNFGVRLTDLSGRSEKRFLYFHYNSHPSGLLSQDSTLFYSRVFDFCGRQYRIDCYPENAFVEEYTNHSYISIFWLCILLTVTIVLYLTTVVSQRSKAEELVLTRTKELKESEERFRSLIQNSNDIFTILDEEGTIKFISPSVNKILGYNESELKNVNFLSVVHPDDKDKAYQSLLDCVNDPSKMFTLWIRVITKEGTYCDLESVAQNLIDIPGVNGIVVNVRDITERKKVEYELIKAKEKAEEMNRVKSSFFANMSHELRTPLHGILGASQILADSAKDVSQKKFSEMVISSGKRLMSTLNMILNLSRVESNKQEIYYTTVNLSQAVKNSINLLEICARDKKLTLNYYPIAKNLNIYTDEQMLDVLLNNMIDNAVKYTNSGGVKIFTGTESINGSQFVYIKVQDTGIGISEENLSVIFEEFRQVSEGFNRSFEGTGLGLSIMKKYIDLLNGMIKVESKLNEGSVFCVWLPLLKTVKHDEISEVDTPAMIADASGEAVKKSKILLVDDDQITFNILSLWLKKIAILDYANDAEEAYTFLRENSYSVVLLDINLKRGVNGIDVLKKLRTFDGYRDVPVIACTAYAMSGDKENLLSEGFNYYISKPFDRTELNATITKAVENIN